MAKVLLFTAGWIAVAFAAALLFTIGAILGQRRGYQEATDAAVDEVRAAEHQAQLARAEAERLRRELLQVRADNVMLLERNL